jgi:hypothetical protein
MPEDAERDDIVARGVEVESPTRSGALLSFHRAASGQASNAGSAGSASAASEQLNQFLIGESTPELEGFMRAIKGSSRAFVWSRSGCRYPTAAKTPPGGY